MKIYSLSKAQTLVIGIFSQRECKAQAGLVQKKGDNK
jgi:hypothetical protein